MRAGQDSDLRFLQLYKSFVLPVKIFLRPDDGSVSVQNLIYTAGSADARISKVCHQISNRITCEHARGVRENDNFAIKLRNGIIQAVNLSAIYGKLQKPHTPFSLALDYGANNSSRGIGRTIRCDDDLELVHRIVKSQRVANLGLDHIRFVISRDQQRSRWLNPRLAYRTPEQ